MKTISKEKLNSYSSKELLDILNKTFLIHALCNPKTRLQITKYQKEIVNIIWKNFPEVAKKEGLKWN